MIALGANAEDLQRYIDLKADDLKASTAIVDPNGRGHRDDTLAWFFKMDLEIDVSRDRYMKECMSFHFYSYTTYRTQFCSLSRALVESQSSSGSMGRGV